MTLAGKYWHIVPFLGRTTDDVIARATSLSRRTILRLKRELDIPGLRGSQPGRAGKKNLERRAEVMRLLHFGLTTAQVADCVGISVRRVQIIRRTEEGLS